MIVVDGRGMCGLHFCNPQTVGRGVGGGVWVTFCNPQMMEFCGVCGECVGYFFVTRNEACVAVVVGMGMYGLHKLEK